MVVLERWIACYSVSQTKSSILWRVFGEQCSIRLDAGLVTYDIAASTDTKRRRAGNYSRFCELICWVVLVALATSR